MSKKERKTCSDSTHSLEHENGRLRSEYDQLSKDMGFPLLVNPITLFGMNGANHTSVKMPEEEERYMTNSQLTILYLLLAILMGGSGRDKVCE